MLHVTRGSGISFVKLLFMISQLTNSGVSTFDAMTKTALVFVEMENAKEAAKNSGFSGFVRRCFSWLKKPFGCEV